MVQWFKRHPDFLRSESQALSNNSNYKELFQLRDNIFISHGEIIVRLNETHKFPILIVYSDSTPYSLPEIFPLKKTLTKEKLDELIKLNSYQVYEKIKSDVEFYYNLRHQNNTGNLCIIEWDNLDDGSKFFGISSVLKRVRDWYAGHFTGNFPLDNQEIELFSHFSITNNELTLLYSDEYLDENITEGDAYSALTGIVRKSRFSENERYIYTGFLLEGFSKAGLLVNTNKNLKYNLHEKLKTSADLHLNSEIVKRLINEKILLQACWFHTIVEPKPFEKFSELIEIIGNGNYENGIKRIEDRCSTYLSTDADNFYIGLRFANRRGIVEFILFKIYKKNNPPTLDLDPKNKLKSMTERYERVEAVECEKITEETFHLRNSKRADYGILKEHTINVLGVGAIGSEVSDCLSKAGVGHLVLVDNQTLKANNSVRHLAGQEYIGQTKVNAVASILENHTPFVKIAPVPSNLTYVSPNRNLTQDSISISSVADDNVEGYLNEQFVISNHTCFYVRALRGGKIGRIFRVIPGKDACFHCLNLYRNEKKEFIDIPVDPDYPTLKNECNNPIRPASAADLKLLASLSSSILIDFLQGKGNQDNHWIWSSEIVDGTSIDTPYKVYSQSIKIHPKCSYCNLDKKHEVILSNANVEFMQNLVMHNPTVETGGVLAGTRDEKGNLVISHVSGPGPKAIKENTRFEKDIEYCQAFLDKLYLESNKSIVYLGEWHSHPSENNKPSGQDIESLTSIAEQKEYLTTEPVSIILSNKGQLSCTIHPAGKRYYYSKLTIY